MINKNFEFQNNFYISINLSFFSGEKTEEATPKKKRDARQEGQVAISKEIATAITIIGGFLALKFLGNYMYKKCYEIMLFNFSAIQDLEKVLGEKYLFNFFIYIVFRILVICAPLFLITLFIGLVTNILQVGWHPTTKPLKPKFEAFNPVNGFKRIFSGKQVVETLISILKVTFIGFIIYNEITKQINQIRSILYMSLIEAVIFIFDFVLDIGITVGYWFILIAVLDFAYQRYSHSKKLRMSKQDIKDEYKQIDGDPLIKSKIRQKMREASLKRMMQDIPGADVVITNPTHYAIAIKYDREKEVVPTVVAKGVDHLAQKIKEIAKENNIEIVENKSLARALYSTVDIGKEIPPELYQAVAEVLAFVYKLKNML